MRDGVGSPPDRTRLGSRNLFPMPKSMRGPVSSWNHLPSAPERPVTRAASGHHRRSVTESTWRPSGVDVFAVSPTLASVRAACVSLAGATGALRGGSQIRIGYRRRIEGARAFCGRLDAQDRLEVASKADLRRRYCRHQHARRCLTASASPAASTQELTAYGCGTRLQRGCDVPCRAGRVRKRRGGTSIYSLTYSNALMHFSLSFSHSSHHPSIHPLPYFFCRPLPPFATLIAPAAPSIHRSLPPSLPLPSFLPSQRGIGPFPTPPSLCLAKL